MNLKQAWVLQIDPGVSKILKKFPQKDARRILTALESLPKILLVVIFKK